MLGASHLGLWPYGPDSEDWRCAAVRRLGACVSSAILCGRGQRGVLKKPYFLPNALEVESHVLV